MKLRLLLLSIFLIKNIKTENELLKIDQVPIIYEISENLEEGDLIVNNQQIRARPELTESVNVELDGSGPLPIAINNSMIVPGESVRFILVNKKAFLEQSNPLKLQAIGVITGKYQECLINLHSVSKDNRSRKLQDINIPKLMLKDHFETKQTAVVKLSSKVPKNTEVKLIGDHSERVKIEVTEDNLIIDTVPCETNEIDDDCDVELPISLLVVLTNGSERFVANLVLDEENKNDKLQMSRKMYRTVIEEHTGRQDKLLKVSAKGNDSEILYSLRDSSGLFAIHPKEGILSILHPEFLTISTFGEHIDITAVASTLTPNGEQSATSTIRVHIRRQKKDSSSSIFGFVQEQYSFTTSMVEGRFIANIAASPADSELVYSITEGDTQSYVVEPNGNLIYTGELTKQSRSDSLMVTVRDESRMDSTKVTIDLKGIGSNPVQLNDEEQKIVTITNEDVPGVVVDTIQFADKDKDSNIVFKCVNLEALDLNSNAVKANCSLFEIKNDGSNSAIIVLKESLEDLEVASLKMQIHAKDEAHPAEPIAKVTRVIIIENVKQEKPLEMCSVIPISDKIRVLRTSPIGTWIYQIHCVPNIRHLKYSIEPDHLFDISDNGTITSILSLTNEKTHIPLRINLSNGKETRNLKTMIELYQNQMPTFNEKMYNVKVNEMNEGKMILTVQAMNNEGDTIENDYKLEGYQSKLFTIDGKGNVKALKGAEELRSVDMIVSLMSDPRISVPIHIEIETPRSEVINLMEKQLVATIYDNSPPNSYISRIEVLDIDKGENIKYTLSSDEPELSKYFTIHSNGVIRTNKFLYGFKGMHELLVTASSIDAAGIRTNNASLIIDILRSNECQPKFKPKNHLFRIMENKPSGTVIGKLEAEYLDESCSLRFGLWDYGSSSLIHENDAVVVDEKTGEIRSNTPFDYESTKKIIVTFAIVAGKHLKATTPAEIVILDEDDNSVAFVKKSMTVQMREDAKVGTVVATVKAVDNDSQMVYYHLGSQSPPQFSIHSTTGAVILEQQVDREVDEQFEILIGASNDPHTLQEKWQSSMFLNIIVEDVNDNAPEFEQQNYDIVIEKNTIIGSQIITLNAFDKDQNDRDHILEYSIEKVNFEYRGMHRIIEDVFDMTKRDGIIITSHKLENYVGGVFIINVMVLDKNDKKTGEARVRVFVHDNSDLVAAEIGYKPNYITPEHVHDMTRHISNTTNLAVIPKNVVYKSTLGVISPSSVNINMIFFNKTTSEIVPADMVLAYIDRKQLKKSLPGLEKYTIETIQKSPHSQEAYIPNEFLIVAIIFIVALIIMFTICGLMLCYHKSKYRNVKKAAENEAAIKDALNQPKSRSPALLSFKHYPSPVPEMPRPIPNGDDYKYKPTNIDTNVGSYAIQQATITVEENEEKIVR